MVLKRLNKKGISEFEDYLAGGAEGSPPVQLLKDPACSETVSAKISPPEDISFLPDRYVLGNHLTGLFSDFNPTDIANDRGLWTGLALLWFDSLCPPDASGKRKLSKDYHYILSTDYRHYYRHLIRSPWQLVRDHQQNSKFLLIAPREKDERLGRHGDILEQFGGRQQVLASQRIIAAANRMYFDPATHRPRKGAAGSGKGSARRFGLVFRQFDLTYDPASMPPDAITGLLPSEFERWKAGL